MARLKPYAITEAQSESDAWHRKTEALWDNDQHRLAFRRLLVAANRGDCTAQLNLGYFYDCGLGIPRKQRLARHWYERAYRQGNASAANNIGTIYRDRGEFQTALIWFERAIAMGDLSANWEVARMYFKQRKDIPNTIKRLERIINARPGIEVTRWDFEAATRLLWRLERRQTAACASVAPSKSA